MRNKRLESYRSFVDSSFREQPKGSGDGGAAASGGVPASTTPGAEKGVVRLTNPNAIKPGKHSQQFRAGELWRVWLIRKTWFHVFANFTRHGNLYLTWSIWDHYWKKRPHFYGWSSCVHLNQTISILQWQLARHQRDLLELGQYFRSNGMYILPERFRIVIERLEEFWALSCTSNRYPNIRYGTKVFLRSLALDEKYLSDRINHENKWEPNMYRHYSRYENEVGIRRFAKKQADEFKDQVEENPPTSLGGRGEEDRQNLGLPETFFDEE